MARKSGRSLLQEALAQKGLTTRQAALLLGVTSGSVVHWTTGRRLPSRVKAAVLARVLGVPVDAWQIEELARESA
jgi:transcriptional regulator with XRE-family HTH domain